MNDRAKPMTRKEALLQRAEVLRALDAVLAELADMDPLTEEAHVGSASAPLDKSEPEKLDKDNLVKLPLGDAIVQILKSCEKPLTAFSIKNLG